MQIVNINLVPSGVNPIVYASQHDNGRVVRFHLMNNSSEWNLDPSDTIRADITRPDGTELSIPMTNDATSYSDLTISYDDLDQEGVYVGEVVITDQYDNVTGSLNFILKAEADPYGDDVTTETASGNPCTFETNLADTLVSLKAAILASGGGGTPSTPIPIVGHSELNLVRCGKNLARSDYTSGASKTTNGVTFTNNNGVVNVSAEMATGTAYYDIYANIDGERLKIKAGTYTVSCAETTSNCTISFAVTGGSLYVLHQNTHSVTFTVTQDTELYAYIRVSSGASNINLDLYFQIEVGSTPTPYAPYNGTPYLVQFGQTVYGGLYDANRGKVTITHQSVMVDGSYFDGYNADRWARGAFSGAEQDNAKTKTSMYPVGGSSGDRFTWLVQGYFRIYDSSFTSLADVQTKFNANPMQLVYALATPIEIDVSELSVDTIVGVNNIVSDGGGDVEVTYIKKV